MAVAGLPTLFLNEGRAVKTARSLTEGAAAVVSVDANRLDPANDGKLVHFSGLADTDETLQDERFGVSAKAIRLNRHVEIYQWKEIAQTITREVDGNKTTETKYSYDKKWDSELASSSKFHDSANHQNPAAARFESKSFQANDVRVGQFQLSTDLVAKIDSPEALEVSLSNVPDNLLPNVRADGGNDTNAAGLYWSIRPVEQRIQTDVAEVEPSEAESPKNSFSFAETIDDNSPAENKPQPAETPTPADNTPQPADDAPQATDESPQIGDTRIRFTVTRPEVVSVVAAQTGSTLQPYKTSNGRTLSMLSSGEQSAETMFDRAQQANTIFTWGLRMIGTAMMIFGVGMAMSPLTSMTNWIPIVGNMVGMGVAVTAILLGGGVALLTMSFAWLFYRPLVAVPMIVVGVVMIGLLFRPGGKKSNSTNDAAQPVYVAEPVEDGSSPT